MTPPPTPRSGAPVFPGIAKFKAEPPMAGYGHQWQINGCVEDGNPDDIESYGWIAEVNSAWGNESGDLARFLARAANSHDALVAALEEHEFEDTELGMVCIVCQRDPERLKTGQHEPDCWLAAILSTARGEPS